MKKYGIMLGCATLALAAIGIAACDNTRPEPTDPQSYTVSFETLGGGVLDSQTVSDGETAVRPTDPQKTGWVFDGWYLDGVEYKFTEQVTGDITLSAKYSSLLGGDGTELSPFTIDNAEELALLGTYINAGESEFVSAYYVQTADITSAGFTTFAEFSGIYDGGNHELDLDAPFFNSLGGTVKDLKIACEATVTGDSVGMLANTAAGANIENVSVEGSITATNGVVGGIVGTLKSGRIEFSVSAAEVNGKTAGGLVGESSGVVINSEASGNVTATETAGGIVGVLGSGGVAQNVGFSASVESQDVAGGAIGDKKYGSAVFRAFVFGDGSVSGKHAGGVVGTLSRTFGQHADVVGGYFTSGVTVDGSVDTTVCYGVSVKDDLSDIGLPSFAWGMTSVDAPALLGSRTDSPVSVVISVDGTETSVEYGSHVREELFTLSDTHFSDLLEIDGDIELKSASPVHGELSGFAFDAGYTQVAFAASGATLTVGASGTAKKLDHVNTFAYTDTFEHTYVSGGFDYVEDIEYNAPVSIYTDGTDYYAFVITKEELSPYYVGFLQSFVKTGDEWTPCDDWYPRSDIPVGAYSYFVGENMLVSYSHYVVISDDYTVENGEGYYPTHFMQKRTDKLDGSVTFADTTVGRGQTMLFLGDSEYNAPITVFVIPASYHNEVDFVYVNSDGKLVNSAGSELVIATEEYLTGTWFDGTNKYTFDTENKTVTVVGASSQTVPYTTRDGVINFTVGNATRELVVAPTPYGAYKLASTGGGADLTVATYISDSFDGSWITENGDALTVSSAPAASLTFNGTAVEVSETVYNGVQALTFNVGSKEYYFVNYRETEVKALICDGHETYAFDTEILSEVFGGEYVTFADGVRSELEVSDDLTVSLSTNGGAAATGKALPFKTFIGDGSGNYGMSVTIGGTEYNIERTADVLIAKTSDAEFAFGSVEAFSRYVGEFTNGTETLEITSDGKFARYANGETAPAEYSTLTAKFKADRAQVWDGCGFVLSYTDGDDERYFYVDVDVFNVRLFKVTKSDKGENLKQIDNFIPASELTSVYGTFIRELDGGLDTVTIAENKLISHSYPSYFGGSEEEEYYWYPVLDYNTNTNTSRVSIYTTESTDGAVFESLIDFNGMGMTWGMNGYISKEVYDAFNPYLADVYTTNIGGLPVYVTLGTSRLTLTRLALKDGKYVENVENYAYDSCSINGTSMSLTATQTGFGLETYKTATVSLSDSFGSKALMLAIDGENTLVLDGKEKLDYNSLKGDYACGDDTYKFVVEDSWFGGMSVSLKVKIGSASEKSYSYSLSSGVLLVSDGNQALAVGSAYIGYKYVWKDGNDLMVCDSLDASKAIKAKNTASAGTLTVDEIKDLLDEMTLYNADKTKSLLFENFANPIFGSNIFSFTATDDEGNENDYSFDSGEVSGNVCTMEFSAAFDSITVTVTVTDDGQIEKVAFDGEDYFPPASLPAVSELQNLLDGKKFASADGAKSIEFAVESGIIGSQFAAVFDDDEDTKMFYDNKGVQNGNVYTLVFEFRTKTTVTVTLNDDSTVQKVVVDGVEYTPVE